MFKPKLLVLATGSEKSGGTGFQNLVEQMWSGRLIANIEVASNHEFGGVRQRADELKIPFRYFPGPWTAEAYQRLADASGADYFALSGWLKLAEGLDLDTNFNSTTVFNIHPGPLPAFGGKGLYGHYVHEAVMAAYHRGEITHTEVCMHFVTPKFDEGPIFLRVKIPIRKDDTPETLAKRVNLIEHKYQPRLTNCVLNGSISWDGFDVTTLKVPLIYSQPIMEED